MSQSFLPFFITQVSFSISVSIPVPFFVAVVRTQRLMLEITHLGRLRYGRAKAWSCVY